MANERTNFENAYSSTLAASLGSVATTMSVAAAPAIPAPYYLVLEPDSATKREYVKVTAVAGTNLTVTRYLTGSAAPSGITHDSGVEVTIAPTAQAFEDLHDRVSGHTHAGGDAGAALSHDNLSGVSADDHHPQVHAHNGVDGSGTIDHGSLTGRNDDDHTQYLRADGTRAMTGQLNAGAGALLGAALDMGGFDIVNLGDILAGTFKGMDPAAHAARHQLGGADPIVIGDHIQLGGDTQPGSLTWGALTLSYVTKASVAFTKPANWTSYNVLAVAFATFGSSASGGRGALRASIAGEGGPEVWAAPFASTIMDTASAFAFHYRAGLTTGSMTIAALLKEEIAAAEWLTASIVYIAVRAS